MHQMTRVVDLSNSASFEDASVMKFFEASTRNLLAQGAAAGVKQLADISFDGGKVRLPDALPKASCV